MRQLTGLDAQFLAAEDGRNHGHVSANITVLSYQDSLDVGVVGCRELVPDAWSLIEHIDAELTELRGLLVPAKKRPHRSGSTTKAVTSK